MSWVMFIAHTPCDDEYCDAGGITVFPEHARRHAKSFVKAFVTGCVRVREMRWYVSPMEDVYSRAIAWFWNTLYGVQCLFPLFCTQSNDITKTTYRPANLETMWLIVCSTRIARCVGPGHGGPWTKPKSVHENNSAFPKSVQISL